MPLSRTPPTRMRLLRPAATAGALPCNAPTPMWRIPSTGASPFMSKKSRSKDNSKRPQPLAQQRAQAHQSTMGMPQAAKEKQANGNGNGKAEKKDKSDRQR